MERHSVRILVTLLFFAASCRLLAAESPEEPRRQPSPSSDAEEIVVTNIRLETLREIMRDFVMEVGDPVSNSRGLARWRKGVCVGIYNLKSPERAQFIADRISLLAYDLGLQPGEPGCRPDIQVIFSTDGRDMATRLVETVPDAFRPFGNTQGTTQGTAALEEFKNSDAPVRWWQITMVVDELGRAAIDLFMGQEAVPQYRGSNSRVKEGASDDIWGSLVIVDTSKLEQKTWSQLADYIAMVSLAQVKPGNRPDNHDSILNLFSEANPKSLSDMDFIYLKSLYSMDTYIRPRTQRGMLASWMIRTQREMEEVE